MSALVALTLTLGVVRPAAGATPPVPTMSGAVAGPGLMYPNPAVSVVPDAVKVEDFPYITEEFFVSGTANGAPYTTRIIVRRPRDPKQFSGTVVAEALHAGGRSLIFEWSRVSILTRHHMFVEIVHSAGEHQPAQDVQRRALRVAEHRAGADQRGHRAGRHADQERHRPCWRVHVRQITLMGTSASSGTVRNYLAAHAELAHGQWRSDLRRLPPDQHQRQHAAADRGRADDPDADADRGGHVGRSGHRLSPARQRRAGQSLPALRGRRHAAQQLARQPRVPSDPCTLPVTDFPAGAFTALGLNHLIEWIAKGKTPPHAPPIAVDQNTANDGSHLALDEHGNAKGGIRNVWVDVPIATNGVFGKGKTTAQDRLCQLAGTKVPLPEATLKKLYRNKAEYQSKVNARLAELIKGGWFLQEVRGHGSQGRAGHHDSLSSNRCSAGL